MVALSLTICSRSPSLSLSPNVFEIIFKLAHREREGKPFLSIYADKKTSGIVYKENLYLFPKFKQYILKITRKHLLLEWTFFGKRKQERRAQFSFFIHDTLIPCQARLVPLCSFRFAIDVVAERIRFCKPGGQILQENVCFLPSSSVLTLVEKSFQIFWF